MTKKLEETEAQAATRVRDNRRVQKEWRKLRDEERARRTQAERRHKNPE